MTFLELAERVLKEVEKPMSSSEIWDYATKASLNIELGSQGKTPYATLAAQLHVNARDKKNSLFATIGSRPKKFYLKSLKYDKALLVEEDLEAKGEVEDTLRYSEIDLHQLLAYFVYYHMKAHSKTLDHTKTSKKYYGEWIHPDMVACYFSIDELKSEVYDLIRSINNHPFGSILLKLKKS